MHVLLQSKKLLNSHPTPPNCLGLVPSNLEDLTVRDGGEGIGMFSTAAFHFIFWQEFRIALRNGFKL